MLKTIPDINKFKKLYNSLSMNMSIDEKNYIYTIFLEPSVVDVIIEWGRYGDHIQINYDIDGNPLIIMADDREIYNEV